MMLRPITRPLVRPLTRRVTEPGFGWSPRALFANGEQGAWYDPSDLSTLYQDSAGTTPVTAVGQPVGLMLDKSGRGNHAGQPTATARPTLQADASGRKYLQFDGVDDSMISPAFLGGASDHLIALGMRFLGGGSSWQGVAEWSPSPDGAAGFVGLGRLSSTANSAARLDTADSHTTGYNQNATEVGELAFNGANHVLSASARTSANQLSLRVDGAAAVTKGLVGPLPDFSAKSRPIRIAKGTGYPSYANIRLYSFICMFSPTAISQAQIAAAERYAAAKTGVTLA